MGYCPPKIIISLFNKLETLTFTSVSTETFPVLLTLKLNVSLSKPFLFTKISLRLNFLMISPGIVIATLRPVLTEIEIPADSDGGFFS